MNFPPDPTHRLYAPELGGGALLDLGIYPVSWVFMVLGTPTSVTAVADPTFTGVDGQTSVVLRYPDGVHGIATCTLWAWTPQRAWIAGTEGLIDVQGSFYAPTSFTLRRGRSGEPEQFEPSDTLEGDGKGMRYEAAEVARCVGEGLLESPGMPLDETVEIMRTFDEIRRQTGVPAEPNLTQPPDSGLGSRRPRQLPQQAQGDPRRQGPLGEAELGEVVEHPLVVLRRGEGRPDQPASAALAPAAPRRRRRLTGRGSPGRAGSCGAGAGRSGPAAPPGSAARRPRDGRRAGPRPRPGPPAHR